MAKKTFGIPLVFGLIADPTDAVETGPATGQGHMDVRPIGYDEWLRSPYTEGYDLKEDGKYTFDEYGRWWADEGFGIDAWHEYNPNQPWDPDWEE